MSDEPTKVENAPIQLACWKDFFNYQPMVVAACLRSPLALTALVAVCVSGSVLPAKSSRGLNLSLTCMVAAIGCRLIPDLLAKLNGTPRQEVVADFARLPSAVGISILYGLASSLGVLALVIPGVIVMVCGSLANVVTCAEKRGPLDSFMASDRLIKGRFWRTFSYLVPVPLCLFCAGYLIYYVVWILVDSDTVSAILKSVFALFVSWIAISAIVLQVRLYSFLKQNQA